MFSTFFTGMQLKNILLYFLHNKGGNCCSGGPFQPGSTVVRFSLLYFNFFQKVCLSVNHVISVQLHGLHSMAPVICLVFQISEILKNNTNYPHNYIIIACRPCNYIHQFRFLNNKSFHTRKTRNCNLNNVTLLIMLH